MTFKLTKNAARCRLCHTTIESAHHHDYQTCPCGEIMIDGGLEYVRRGARNMKNLEDLSTWVEREKETV